MSAGRRLPFAELEDRRGEAAGGGDLQGQSGRVSLRKLQAAQVELSGPRWEGGARLELEACGGFGLFTPSFSFF